MLVASWLAARVVSRLSKSVRRRTPHFARQSSPTCASDRAADCLRIQKPEIQKSGAWLPNVSANHESRNARKTPNQTPPFLMHLFLVSWLSNNPSQSSRTKPTRAAPGPPFMAVDLRAHLRGGEEGIFAPVHRRAGGMARPGRKNVIECRSP